MCFWHRSVYLQCLQPVPPVLARPVMGSTSLEFFWTLSQLRFLEALPEGVWQFWVEGHCFCHSQSHNEGSLPRSLNPCCTGPTTCRKSLAPPSPLTACCWTLVSTSTGCCGPEMPGTQLGDKSRAPGLASQLKFEQIGKLRYSLKHGRQTLKQEEARSP